MIKAILIEAGHGKSLLGRLDVGAVGNDRTERALVVQIGRLVLDILKNKPELSGVLVQGIGIETEANLGKKIQFVNHVILENKLTSDEVVSLSIHMNSAGDSKANGFEVWYQKKPKKNTALLCESMVRSWQEYAITALRNSAINPSSWDRWGRLYIDDYLSTAVLVECGFISNKQDVDNVVGNLPRVAECLAHGLMEYIRSVNS